MICRFDSYFFQKKNGENGRRTEIGFQQSKHRFESDMQLKIALAQMVRALHLKCSFFERVESLVKKIHQKRLKNV